MSDGELEGIGWCACGAAWFELAPFEDTDADADIGAAVCISPEGDVTGYAGRLVCTECGEDWAPRQRPLLRIVKGD